MDSDLKIVIVFLYGYFPVASLVFFPKFRELGRDNLLDTSATNWLILPVPDDRCGAIGGMKIGKGN